MMQVARIFNVTINLEPMNDDDRHKSANKLNEKDQSFCESLVNDFPTIFGSSETQDLAVNAEDSDDDGDYFGNLRQVSFCFFNQKSTS